MKAFDARLGDLVVTTRSVRWKPPFDLVRVAVIDGEGWAVSFRSLDGAKQWEAGPHESCFLFVPDPLASLPAILLLVRRAKSLLEVQRALTPFRHLEWYATHP